MNTPLALFLIVTNLLLIAFVDSRYLFINWLAVGFVAGYWLSGYGFTAKGSISIND